MYERLESYYQENSIKKNIAKLCIGLGFIFIIVFLVISIHYKTKEAIIFSFLGLLFLLFIICYFFMCFIVFKTKPYNIELKGKNLINKYFSYIIVNYKECNIKYDAVLIQTACCNFKINSKEDIKEMIRHYQSVLPRKTIGGGYLLSVIAITLSVITGICSLLNFQIELLDGSWDTTKNLFSAIVLMILCVIILYFLVRRISQYIIPVFSKYDLYVDIEEALSRYYFSYEEFEKNKYKCLVCNKCDDKDMDIERVWNNIIKCEGLVFTLIRGGKFTYKIQGEYLVLSRTNNKISKTDLNKGLKLCPLKNTVPLQNFRAPSYIYALLTDERINI